MKSRFNILNSYKISINVTMIYPIFILNETLSFTLLLPLHPPHPQHPPHGADVDNCTNINNT